MRLLDLFCGAGGAAVGYHRAGFDEIVGVDNRPQPHYPFRFVQADALEFCAAHGAEFDAIHASPPCQGYSRMRYLPWLRDKEYPLLIDATRHLLEMADRPWVIENVADAPLAGALLCGAALGLPFSRHRRFESSILLLFPSCPGHAAIYPGGSQMSQRGRRGGVMGMPSGSDPLVIMGCEWMTMREARQAVPPAYTEWIGAHLLAHLLA